MQENDPPKHVFWPRSSTPSARPNPCDGSPRPSDVGLMDGSSPASPVSPGVRIEGAGEGIIMLSQDKYIPALFLEGSNLQSGLHMPIICGY